MARQRFWLFLYKLKKTSVVWLAAAVLVMSLVLKASATGAEIQITNRTGFDTNLINFNRTEYVGQCPGTGITPSSIKARFISQSLPTAPSRRVIIKNVTKGINNDPYPYTNREYDEGQYSQGFNIGFGDKHYTRTFSVLEGENQLEYEIREKDKVLEQGSLTLEVAVKDLGVFPREVICTDRESCHDQTYYDYRRKKHRTRRVCQVINQCYCPQ